MSVPCTIQYTVAFGTFLQLKFLNIKLLVIILFSKILCYKICLYSKCTVIFRLIIMFISAFFGILSSESR
jgi:hypothetical protein